MTERGYQTEWFVMAMKRMLTSRSLVWATQSTAVRKLS
jgi:hypothetical protein